MIDLARRLRRFWYTPYTPRPAAISAEDRDAIVKASVGMFETNKPSDDFLEILIEHALGRRIDLQGEAKKIADKRPTDIYPFRPVK